MGKPHIETMSVLWYKNETLLKVHIEKSKASLDWPGSESMGAVIFDQSTSEGINLFSF